ncbi:hypothetical protein ACKFKG_30260 [Phormidesmis sp. 146-35]
MDTETTQASIQLSASGDLIGEAARKLQQFFAQQDDTVYDLMFLRQAIIVWLELSVEQLAQEADWHCHTGIAQYAFNRNGFEIALQKYQKVAMQ